MKQYRNQSQIENAAQAFLKSIGENDNANGETFEETAERFRKMGANEWADKMDVFAAAWWSLEPGQSQE